jgi:hypothetical protein
MPSRHFSNRIVAVQVRNWRKKSGACALDFHSATSLCRKAACFSTGG